jgi:hypothetical protein
MLESAVADARRAEAEKQAEAEAAKPAAANQPETVEQTAQSDEEAPRGQVLSDVLRDVRERVNQMGDLIAAKDEVQQSSTPTVQPADDETVEDDLEARRQRLSKPK